MLTDYDCCFCIIVLINKIIGNVAVLITVMIIAASIIIIVIILNNVITIISIIIIIIKLVSVFVSLFFVSLVQGRGWRGKGSLR